MRPDSELCARYGTKSAEVSPLVEAVVAALGTGGLLAGLHHAKTERKEQALAELVARQRAASDMAQTDAGLHGENVPGFAVGFEKGGELELAAHQIVKQALPAIPLGQIAGGLGLQGIGAGAAAAGRASSALAGGLSQGFDATGRLVRAAGPTLMEGIKAPSPIGSALGRAGSALQSGGASMAARGGTLRSAGMAAMNRPAPSLLPKTLLSTSTKAKLLGGAAVLGAGYAGMKGLGAVRDYMSTPAGQHGSGYLRHDVNEYGY